MSEFGVHDVRDHAHEWRVVETRSDPAVDGGETVVEECRFDDCEGWRVRWRSAPQQTTLPAGGGEA
jgi:hypothetical protein